MKSVRRGALLVAGLLAVGLVLVAPASAARHVARGVSAAEAESEADAEDVGLLQVSATEGADDDGTYYDAANMPSWLVPPWVQPNSPTGPLIPTYGSGYTSKTFNVQKWKGAVPPQPVFPLDSGYAYSAIDNDHFPQSGVFPNDARYHSPALSVTAPIFVETDARITAAAADADADTDADADADSDAADADAEDSGSEADAEEETDEADADADAAADESEEAEAEAAPAPMRVPTPPPPPYASVLLQIESQIAAAERASADSDAKSKAAAATTAAAKAKSAAAVAAAAVAKSKAKIVAGTRVRTALDAKARASADAAQRLRLRGQSHSTAAAKGQARSGSGDPFPDQDFTYKDVSSPPDWLVPEKSEPAGPTTKPPPVPQMIPPPPPVPFPTYNYHDPNSAGPFSQYAPGVQGWGYDGGYAGPYDGYSLYGHPPNPAEARGWGMSSVPRSAAQIKAFTAAGQYHPYGAPPPLYAMGQPPPDGAASWLPIGAVLKPGTMEGGAGEED